jgi:hypothetical protein
MMPKLHSISGLAVELDKDRRTVASALRGVPADGKAGKYDAWYLSTALRHLGHSVKVTRGGQGDRNAPLLDMWVGRVRDYQSI